MKQLHETQLGILKKMLFANKLHYIKLKPNPEMENNQFDFHLKELIKAGYVHKKDKEYSLTSMGKEYANRMDTDKVVITQQAKISAWLCCRKKIKNKYQYLIYTRLKQPFYGCQGFPSGKVNYGERVIEAAKRELKEETSLTGIPNIVTIKHYIVFDKNSKELLEDKFMFLCLFENPGGKLKTNNEGMYKWVDEKDLKKYVTNHFESWKAFVEQLSEIKSFKGRISLQEVDHFSVKF